MRDDKWLFTKLDEVWDTYFSDVPQDNDVRIVWGRRARTRLGSIKQDRRSSKHNEQGNHPGTVITINSLFKDEFVPEYVVIGTIAHELAHYAHGFHSPLEQKYATPHAGGVVHREMEGRGLKSIHQKQKRWLKQNWREYVNKELPRKTRPRSGRIIFKWV